MYMKTGLKETVWPGCCVCERFIWMNSCMYLGTLVAAANCALACLSTTGMQKLIMNPSARKFSQEYAASYVIHHNDMLRKAPDSIDDITVGCFNAEEVAREIAGGMMIRRRHQSSKMIDMICAQTHTF